MGLIKKIGRTCKYSLTALGKQAISIGFNLKDLDIILELANAAAPLRSAARICQGVMHIGNQSSA